MVFLAGCAALLALALAFVSYYAVHYVTRYTPESYDMYWPRRGWLLLHLSGGLLALFVGPWQFWTGLRDAVPRIHRWTGRLFLVGVAIGTIGATGLALTTTFGWAWGVGVGSLAVAWAATTAMAFYAILNGAVAAHKEWMVRAYAVTFAFVADRLLDDWLPTSQLQPDGDKMVTDIWLSWVVPLLATVIVQSVLAIRVPSRARQQPRPAIAA